MHHRTDIPLLRRRGDAAGQRLSSNISKALNIKKFSVCQGYICLSVFGLDVELPR